MATETFQDVLGTLEESSFNSSLFALKQQIIQTVAIAERPGLRGVGEIIEQYRKLQEGRGQSEEIIWVSSLLRNINSFLKNQLSAEQFRSKVGVRRLQIKQVVSAPMQIPVSCVGDMRLLDQQFSGEMSPLKQLEIQIEELDQGSSIKEHLQQKLKAKQLIKKHATTVSQSRRVEQLDRPSQKLKLSDLSRMPRQRSEGEQFSLSRAYSPESAEQFWRFRRCSLKSKSCLFRKEGVTVGCITRRKDFNKLQVDLYLTADDTVIEKLQFLLDFNSTVGCTFESQLFQRLDSTQRRLTISAELIKTPIVPPSLQVRGVVGRETRQFAVLLPCVLLKFMRVLPCSSAQFTLLHRPRVAAAREFKVDSHVTTDYLNKLVELSVQLQDGGVGLACGYEMFEGRFSFRFSLSGRSCRVEGAWEHDMQELGTELLLCFQQLMLHTTI